MRPHAARVDELLTQLTRLFPPAGCSYAALLEADGHAVGAAGAATAQLFALGAEAEAVVVWFRAGAAPPLPAELAMLLRNAREEA